jgi:hypothetical protein
MQSTYVVADIGSRELKYLHQWLLLGPLFAVALTSLDDFMSFPLEAFPPHVT